MRFFQKIGLAMRRFMVGRYGTDKLNMAMLGVGLVLSLVTMFVHRPWWLNLSLTLLAYVIMFWCIFRCLSRNTYRRYQENRKYLRFLERIEEADWSAEFEYPDACVTTAAEALSLCDDGRALIKYLENEVR